MPRQLVSFQVESLFGLYDHKIPLNQKERITAIIGPNGRGKTVCLKLIDAMFNRRYSFFYSTEFHSCAFLFSDRCVVRIIRKHAQASLELSADEEVDEKTEVTCEFVTADGERAHWNPKRDPKATARVMRDIERYLPFLTRTGREIWTDDRTGEEFSLFEIAEQFDAQLPPSLKASLIENEPKAFRKLINDCKCHLIETQRLLVIRGAEEEIAWRHRPHRTGLTSLAVERKSSTLADQIKSVLSAYATLSQSLDRSFPRRILYDGMRNKLQRHEIDEQLSALETSRKALESAGILEPETESVARVPQGAESVIMNVISVYIDDTKKKLNVFSELLRRIQLFEDLVNKRFIDKRIHINKETGIEVTSKANRNIPLKSLSSGEQHQLVLIFELLFETASGELILLDEPELSLHVAWQKSFIDDLSRIIEANPFDVIMATHSPTLIGSHFNLAIALGDSGNA